MRYLLGPGLRFSTLNASKQTLTFRVPFSVFARKMAKEYKIKDLSSLDLKAGEKREVEVEGIEGGKILLAKHGDKTHALSSKCTHYGAPLKGGVLTPEGRLTCPWHGGEYLKRALKNLAEILCLLSTSLFQCDHRRCRRRTRIGSISKIRHH